MAQSNVLQYRVPNALAKFRWPASRNQHYEQVKTETLEWMSRYPDIFNQKILKLIAEQNMPLLTAEVVPADRDKDILRAGSDQMILFAVYDDLSDVDDIELVHKMHIAMIDAFKHPEKKRPDDEHVIGRLAQDLMLLIKEWIRPNSPALARFIQTMDDYGSAVTSECGDRVSQVYMKFDDYLVIRRETIGARACFALYDAKLDVPDMVYNHPSFKRLNNIGIDIIIISNDIFSYAKEYLRFNGSVFHNSIPIIIQEKNLDIHKAIDFLERYMLGLIEQFMDCVDNLPSWGPEIDSTVRALVDTVAQWIRGNDDWSRNTVRYFGSQVAKVRETMIMTINTSEE